MPSPDPRASRRAPTARRVASRPRPRKGRELRGPLALIGLGLLLLVLVSGPAGTFATARSGGSDSRQGSDSHHGMAPISNPAAARPMSPASSPGADGRGSVDRHTTTRADASSAAAHPDAALAGDGPPSDAVLQAGLDATAAAGIPPGTVAAVLITACQVLVADITGVGRAAFPGYWSSGTFQPAYHDVHIQAATVTSAAVSPHGGPAQLDVTLLWTGAQADGVIAESQEATVRLRSAGGSWTPVHPWDN